MFVGDRGGRVVDFGRRCGRCHWLLLHHHLLLLLLKHGLLCGIHHDWLSDLHLLLSVRVVGVHHNWLGHLLLVLRHHHVLLLLLLLLGHVRVVRINLLLRIWIVGVHHHGLTSLGHVRVACWGLPRHHLISDNCSRAA